MPKKLTATMVLCFDMARDAGGELVRYQGGYWAPRGVHPRALRGGVWHGTPTVEALVARGHATYTEHRPGRGGDFPIAMRLIDPDSAAP